MMYELTKVEDPAKVDKNTTFPDRVYIMDWDCTHKKPKYWEDLYYGGTPTPRDFQYLDGFERFHNIRG
jgi:hypothetical protein